MQEHLHEGVLDGLVGIGGLAKVVISDAQCPALQKRHEAPEPIARDVAFAGQHKRLYFGGKH
jgi:hypothetical protein